jgi:hypothetical protein
VNKRLGVGNAAPNTALDVNKDFATRELNDATAWAATQNNVNIDGAGNLFGMVRLAGAPGANFTFTGLSGGQSGKRVSIYNASGKTLTLSNGSGSSLAANRFLTGTGADVTIANGGTANLLYSPEDAWVLQSSSNGNSATSGIFARRSSDLAISTNTVLTNDAQLLLALVANATYEFSGVIAYNGSNSASDLQLAFTIPAGATIRWSVDQGGTALSVSSITASGAAASTFHCDATPANNQSIFVSGVVVVGGTSGNLQLQEAQVTSANTTTILTNSHLKATRVQ